MVEDGTVSLHAYYTEQSEITGPRAYAALFDDLPTDIPGLVTVVQGLLVHPGYAPLYGFEVPPERWVQISLRSIAEMLARLLDLGPVPLCEARPPERRLVGLCRDDGVLLV